MEQKKKAITNPTAEEPQGEANPVEVELENSNNNVFDKIVDTQQAEVDKVKDDFNMFTIVRLPHSF